MKLFEKNNKKPVLRELPLLPLKDAVPFPGYGFPLYTTRPSLVQALDAAMASDRSVFICPIVTDKDGDVTEADLALYGCVGHIVQLVKLPSQACRVLIECDLRAKITTYVRRQPYFQVEVKTIVDQSTPGPELGALMRTLGQTFRTWALLSGKVPPEIIAAADRTEDPNRLADIACIHTSIKAEQKLELLSMESTAERLNAIAEVIQTEMAVLEIQKQIDEKVKKRMEKHQREYYLHEQVKEIHRELGKEPDDPSGTRELEERLKAKELPDEVRNRIEREIKRLERLQSLTPEAGILRTWLEWIADLPWSVTPRTAPELAQARSILNADHYGMDKPKERILEFIAVRKLSPALKGPILCLVGPPGTGKTSLGRSIASCLGRDFVRVSLGGVRDEAEIRGHRRTYVGALPGKIIQGMKKAGSSDPVFLLDEIDKLASDFRGDPASALLEVLDPEQNRTFQDHYLELTYDLSRVVFVTTANSLHNIPLPLRDRMEIIEIPGYTELEKISIAEGFLVPKQLRENGLDESLVRFSREGLREIIRSYTMESGVRNLEREVANVMRKIARTAVETGALPSPAAPQTTSSAQNDSELQGNLTFGDASPPTEPATTQESAAALPDKPAPAGPRQKAMRFPVKVDAKEVRSRLGTPRHRRDLRLAGQRAGLVHGLAWTELGGTVLPVEACVFDGRGELLLTGSLGDVMKESARTALSFLKSNARRLQLPDNFFEGRDIHIHVPEGAIPKDGPSAGITLTAALLSALSGTASRQGLAMTGEITLTGRLLPVGGIKEKVLAAHRNGFTAVLLPAENKPQMEEIPAEVRRDLTFLCYDSMMEALAAIFSDDATASEPGIPGGSDEKPLDRKITAHSARREQRRT